MPTSSLRRKKNSKIASKLFHNLGNRVSCDYFPKKASEQYQVCVSVSGLKKYYKVVDWPDIQPKIGYVGRSAFLYYYYFICF